MHLSLAVPADVCVCAFFSLARNFWIVHRKNADKTWNKFKATRRLGLLYYHASNRKVFCALPPWHFKKLQVYIFKTLSAYLYYFYSYFPHARFHYAKVDLAWLYNLLCFKPPFDCYKSKQQIIFQGGHIFTFSPVRSSKGHHQFSVDPEIGTFLPGRLCPVRRMMVREGQKARDRFNLNLH